MTRTTRLVVRFFLLCVFILAYGCTSLNCITPPPGMQEEKRKVAAEIAGKLTKIGAAENEGKLKADYEGFLKTEFATLSDRNTSLYLFLSAIDCYLKHGKVGHEIAREMAATVRKQWASLIGLSGAEPLLSPRERDEIRKSDEPLQRLLKAHLVEFGLLSTEG